MRKICKYQLDVDGAEVRFRGRFDGVLNIADEKGYPHAWILEDSQVSEKVYIFDCVCDGWELISNGKYVGSAKDSWGLNWHYFLREG